MPTVTLKQINKNIIDLKKDVELLKEYILEEFELADDVKRDIQESRKRPDSEFIKHSEVVKRYS